MPFCATPQNTKYLLNEYLCTRPGYVPCTIVYRYLCHWINYIYVVLMCGDRAPAQPGLPFGLQSSCLYHIICPCHRAGHIHIASESFVWRTEEENKKENGEKAKKEKGRRRKKACEKENLCAQQ